MRSRAFLLLTLFATITSVTRAIIVAGGDGTQNTTDPFGLGSSSPWNYVGTVNGDSGVYLGDYNGGYWVITANHVGLGNITLPNGDYTAISGSGMQIGGADLFVYQISSNPGLPNLTLAATAPQTNSTASVTMIGNGANRAVTGTTWYVDTTQTTWAWSTTYTGQNSFAQGYSWASGNTMRWGTNVIDGTSNYNNTSLLTTTFNNVTGSAEGATGDSGGGVFYLNGSTWELAGIMDYIGTFNGQLGSTAVFGNLTEFANIAAYDAAILTAIPEPADFATLFGVAAIGFAFWRRRRRA